MQSQSSTNPYEVHCHRCEVTFPVGTKNCVHCGGRISRDRGRLPEAVMNFAGAVEPAGEESQRSSPFSPIALVWVVILVGGTIYRACAGG